MHIATSASTQAAFSRARSLRICRSCSRPSSSSSSTLRRLGCSASPCRTRYSPQPTRGSNKVCLAALLPCCLAPLLPCCLAALLPCCLAALLPCCLAALLPCCLAALLPCCLAAI